MCNRSGKKRRHEKNEINKERVKRGQNVGRDRYEHETAIRLMETMWRKK